MFNRNSREVLFAATLVLIGLIGLAVAQTPQRPATTLPNETPAKFEPTYDGFEYVKRDVMIPMRDGVKLHTVIIVPKGAKRAPILLTRTPYDATALTSHAESSHLGPILTGYDNATDVIVEGGYIRVVQDIRGKYGSEGDYVMNRPVRGPLNPTQVDHATDTYDTIGPLGAKSQGECSINPVAPAIANALADATGVRFPHLPFTPDRIFSKLGPQP